MTHNCQVIDLGHVLAGHKDHALEATSRRENPHDFVQHGVRRLDADKGRQPVGDHRSRPTVGDWARLGRSEAEIRFGADPGGRGRKQVGANVEPKDTPGSAHSLSSDEDVDAGTTAEVEDVLPTIGQTL